MTVVFVICIVAGAVAFLVYCDASPGPYLQRRKDLENLPTILEYAKQNKSNKDKIIKITARISKMELNVSEWQRLHECEVEEIANLARKKSSDIIEAM